MKVAVDFGGGLELLFGDEKKITVELTEAELAAPGGRTLKGLIKVLKDRFVQERPELFVAGDSVRPGILVLVNDSDWELLGQLEYELEEDDKVTFISTLHGG
eukprot:CAMPEP_0113905790 /NCGR_PEP_ID=MMETSP0780_2-20120614/24284_1 /TAXON_ID=652834 /ORGANISM="Palpitomonas bilix" /LENGTH=101 /DNA_ID=CAMNT_0000900111 /DNA_START=60 /DNA_END=365 /DNA_ORIENTATION=- /assembly_acc=CAM_ASM_000599